MELLEYINSIPEDQHARESVRLHLVVQARSKVMDEMPYTDLWSQWSFLRDAAKSDSSEVDGIVSSFLQEARQGPKAPVEVQASVKNAYDSN